MTVFKNLYGEYIAKANKNSSNKLIFCERSIESSWMFDYAFIKFIKSEEDSNESKFDGYHVVENGIFLRTASPIDKEAQYENDEG
ncbi:MAG: hypothetical protein QXT45_08210 [Candidatus Bilamarchaeaceae archaeon]